ncbi:MAG: hypothetical protein KDA89_21240 [Planctomycetaceae bacterium]|nr:hypothetical protein [Planctomycetaceae bacterium]
MSDGDSVPSRPGNVPDDALRHVNDIPAITSAGPLELTPFELFLHRMDNRSGALVFRVALQFSGDVNRDLLSLAFRASARRHQLLNSVLQPVGNSGGAEAELCHWEHVSREPSLEILWSCDVAGSSNQTGGGVADAADSDEMPRFDDVCGTDLLQTFPPVRAIDLTQQSALCATAITRPDRDSPVAEPTVPPSEYNSATNDGRSTEERESLRILLNFHHTACDGMGARQLIADWFHLYDRLCRGETPALAEYETERLMNRGQVRRPPTVEPLSFREAVRNFYVTVCGRTARLRSGTTSSVSAAAGERQSVSHKTVPHAATPQIPEASAVKNHRHSPTWLHQHAFSEEETASIRAWLRRQGVSINDVGVAVCMQTFAELFDDVSPRHLITVLNPVDIRLPSDRRLSAANKTGFTYLRRRRRECLLQTPTELLKSIREQTTYIKERFVGPDFIHGLERLSRRPWALRLMIRSGLFTPSLQFTCLGDTTRGRRYGFRIQDDRFVVGDLTLINITAWAPVAPGVPLSIAACETNSRLTFTVRADPEYLSDAQAQRYLQRLADRITAYVGESDDAA